MELADRIKKIILDNHMKQKEFARSINVSESYISKLLRGECGVSNSTAALIEEKYGYRCEWILNGSGPQLQNTGGKVLSLLQKKIIAQIIEMEEAELKTVKTFIDALDEYKKSLGID